MTWAPCIVSDYRPFRRRLALTARLVKAGATRLPVESGPPSGDRKVTTEAQQQRHQWGYHSHWVKARRTGATCGRCGDPMAAGSVAVVAEQPEWGKAPTCTSCAGKVAPVGGCEGCGRPLAGSILDGRRVCSERCRYWVERRHVCPGCGVTFTPTARRTTRWCSHACYLRVYQPTYRKAHPKPRLGPRPATCQGCGRTFTASRSDARWCSPLCYQRVYLPAWRARKLTPDYQTNRGGIHAD